MAEAGTTNDTGHCRWLRLIKPTRRRIPCGKPVEQGSYCAEHGRRAVRNGEIDAGCGMGSATPSTRASGQDSGSPSIRPRL
jgi:hypothetical protein